MLSESENIGPCPDHLCSLCNSIEYTYLEVPKVLGTIKELSSRTQCVLCCYFSQLLAVEAVLPSPAYTSEQHRPQVVVAMAEGCRPGQSFVLKVDDITRVRIYDQIWENIVSPDPKISKAPSDFDTSGQTERPDHTQSALNRENLDVNRIRRWLDKCEKSHGFCKWPLSTRPVVDVTLIDVVDECLINATSSSRYIALSYVSGGVTGLQATVSNRNLLSQPGSLSRLNEKLPNIIQDAIAATRELGEHFLWVDSLCIIQDDPTTKHVQMSRMDVIYSKAVLTFASLSGTNANLGLPGLQPRSRPIIEPTCSAKLFENWPQGGGGRLVTFHAKPPRLDELLEACPYETRGWTFQERILSQRVVYFTNWQVYFQCQSRLQCEYQDTAYEKETHKVLSGLNPFLKIARMEDTTFLNITGPLHEFLVSEHGRLSYTELVQIYTQRQLTYKSDILNAFGGIVSMLERTLDKGFKYGLPEAFLETALLWMPAGRIKRRDAEIALLDGQKQNFPTWSWCGWEGPVSYSSMTQTGKLRSWFQSEVDWSTTSCDNFVERKPTIPYIPLISQMLRLFGERHLSSDP